ncbi:MAG: DEAD/DEAH box helicase, partial [Bdellovibrionales bacterium]|nr:DEAD/DEAH box helicase [Bdellovibrionales bacterium]
MQTFTELNLSEPLLRALTELGFETPSPIQAQTLPILLGEPTDFLGMAATGTGKTAAYAIPLLERIDPSVKGVQALILCPTRELAQQVAGQIDLLGKFKGIRALPVYGGAAYDEQIRGLRQGLPVVVGTPGRVIDHIQRGRLNLSNLRALILDEADEMVSMGFKEDIESVLTAAPMDKCNIWLFSATMGPDVRKVADTYLRTPKKVQVNRTEMLPDTVEQLYFPVQENDKPEVLCKLIEMADDFYGIVFCQTKALVVDLTDYLVSRGYRADCLHGDMSQEARERTMKAYRDRRFNVLVATDVACRGLDVKDITHVVNFSIPRELDNYVHRIGRTGRIGKQGIAYSLVTRSHAYLLGRLERLTRTRIVEGRVPSRKEIAARRVERSLKAFSADGGSRRMAWKRVSDLMGSGWSEAIAELSKEEIVSRFLAAIHEDIFLDRNTGTAPAE